MVRRHFSLPPRLDALLVDEAHNNSAGLSHSDVVIEALKARYFYADGKPRDAKALARALAELGKPREAGTSANASAAVRTR